MPDGRPIPGGRKKSVLRRRGLGPVAAFGHERIELGLVLGEAQAIEKFAELALLFLETLERVAAVFVEGVITAGGRGTPRRAAAHLRAHPVHLALHALHLVLPAVMTAVISASHSSAPYGEGEDDEAERPPGHEAEDDQRDPGGFAEFIELRGKGHGCASPVNVNNIYIGKAAADGCQAPLR